MMAEAPHIVFLHGMLGSPAMWQPVAAALPPGARVSAELLPFHGLLPWGDSLQTFDDAVAALGARLPSGPIVLVGYSLGGRLALALGCARPEVRAVLAIGAHLGIADEKAHLERRAWEQHMARLARERGLPGLVDEWESLSLFASQVALPKPAFALQRATRLAHHAEAIARAFEVLGTSAMPLLSPRLRAAQAEIVLVAGGLDGAYRSANEQAAVALGCHRVVVADAGHNVGLEAPATLARLIAPHLDLAPRGEPQDVTFGRGEQAS